MPETADGEKFSIKRTLCGSENDDAAIRQPTDREKAVIKKSFNKRRYRILVGCVPQALHISANKGPPLAISRTESCLEKEAARSRGGSGGGVPLSRYQSVRSAAAATAGRVGWRRSATARKSSVPESRVITRQASETPRHSSDHVTPLMTSSQRQVTWPGVPG